MSPLCREITVDGITIQIDIYRGKDDSGWILEVIDEENASTIWDEPFDTDQEALDAAQQTYGVDKEVITAIILVETKLGTYTGKRSVINTLASPCSRI